MIFILEITKGHNFDKNISGVMVLNLCTSSNLTLNSRTSVARTLLARVPRLFKLVLESLGQIP